MMVGPAQHIGTRQQKSLMLALAFRMKDDAFHDTVDLMCGGAQIRVPDFRRRGRAGQRGLLVCQSSRLRCAAR